MFSSLFVTSLVVAVDLNFGLLCQRVWLELDAYVCLLGGVVCLRLFLSLPRSLFVSSVVDVHRFGSVLLCDGRLWSVCCGPVWCFFGFLMHPASVIWRVLRWFAVNYWG